MNSDVGPIFNEKINKKWNLWVHEQYTDALFTAKKSTFAVKVNICGYCSMNSNRVTPKRVKKKKKKEQKHRCGFSGSKHTLSGE